MPEGAALPTGTVTFLFTDIEGSTRLLQRLGDRYPALLEAHQRLLRESFAGRGGVEVATEGDSFFVVFPAAPPAVAAAVHAQRALASHTWPEGTEVKVRMGLHTGEGIRGADNYVGLDLHRAARIAAAGHGGQVVVSDTTRALVERSAPEGVTFRDLGEYRLKDLAHPEHLHQAVVEGLPSDFPPLRSMDVPRGNLPKQLTTFIGRQLQREEVTAALRGTRLLTLTGPGGTGKTRLSIQAAHDLLGEYEDGAFFVPLASITDPSLVVPTIAETLSVPEDPTRMPIESLTDHLAGKEVLLVLDNFEQVLEAAPEVGALLTSTERVSVLATSREPLGLSGEHEYPVPPLGLPDIRHLPSLASLSQYEAVALFIERARAVRPDFEVTNENAPAVAEITTRLDGLPLAIELAAARSKLLAPDAMLKRLEHRMSLLTTSRRDLPERQQTLRGAIAWSYDLLEDEERHLFARLSVFVGGLTVEAAERVSNPDGELGLDTFEGLASLVNKSLVRQIDTDHPEPRFFMLETIREYALERLTDSPEAGEVTERHTTHYVELAEGAAPELFGPRQREVLDTLMHEHDNLRAALDRAVSSNDLTTALRIGAALWRFWQMRGHLREGRDRLERLLVLPGTDDARVRADALEALGGVRYWMGDMLEARQAYSDCLDLRRQLGDPRDIAEALYNLGFTFSTRLSGELAPEQGLERLEEALGIFRELGDEGGTARVMWGMANLRYELEDYEGALPLFREALAIHERLEDPFGMAWDNFELGVTLQRMGRYEEARTFAEAALRLLARAGDSSGVPLVLGGLSSLASRLGEGERAAILYGAATALESAAGGGLTRLNEEWEDWGDVASWRLDPQSAERAQQRGARMSMEEAVSFALEESSPP
jgi:predicted ATPase/class 3 adenylate cyclase